MELEKFCKKEEVKANTKDSFSIFYNSDKQKKKKNGKKEDPKQFQEQGM